VHHKDKPDGLMVAAVMKTMLLTLALQTTITKATQASLLQHVAVEIGVETVAEAAEAVEAALVVVEAAAGTAAEDAKRIIFSK
jgi:hypothetical protein